MQLAQRLYEGADIDGETVGLITYMRTDGVDLAPEAISSARSVIAREFGDAYVPKAPRKYTVKAKNAQEAHEAIRPTDLARLPKRVARALDPDQAKLYELIWTRTIASQMESAELERTTVDILAEAGARKLDLRATGQVIRFDGFLKLYQEGRDDEEDEDGGRLPFMAKDERLKKERIDSTQHFTEPPPRFTEATLVKRMEELGIGRPSTYASTLAVLRERDYVRIDKKRLYPEDKGRLVTAFLESFFTRYVEYDFTADLEEKLDRISNHEIDWKQVLRDFWLDFSAALAGTKDLRTTQVLDALNDILAPAYLPAETRWFEPARLPFLRRRPALAETRQVRRFRRLLQLPRMQVHADPRRRQWRGRRRRASAPASGCSASTPIRATRSRCATGASASMCSRAKARSRSAPPCRRRFPPPI